MGTNLGTRLREAGSPEASSPAITQLGAVWDHFQMIGNHVYSQGYRGFESLSLRNKIKDLRSFGSRESCSFGAFSAQVSAHPPTPEWAPDWAPEGRPEVFAETFPVYLQRLRDWREHDFASCVVARQRTSPPASAGAPARHREKTAPVPEGLLGRHAGGREVEEGRRSRHLLQR